MWKGGGGARQRGVVCGGRRGYEVDSVNSATRTKRWADMTTCGARLPPTCMRKCLPEKDIHKEFARALLEFGWSCLYR